MKNILIGAFLIYIQIISSTSENSGGNVYFPNEIDNLCLQYASLFGDYSPSKNSIALPDLSEIEEACPKTEFFYTFNRMHMKAVAGVKAILEASAQNSTTAFIEAAKALRDRKEIHPKVWYHALTSFANENPTLRKIHKPAPLEIMPDLFINSVTLEKARALEKELELNSTSKKVCIALDETVGDDNGVENKLWYFREDIMLNAHHWFFHLIYPTEPRNRQDREGELFYFVHQNLLARYNSERLSNGLQLTLPIRCIKDAVIEEGYLPHLQDALSGKSWSNRKHQAIFTDVVHVSSKNKTSNVRVEETLMKAKENIARGIDLGYLLAPNGSKTALDNKNGIDLLGDVIQGTKFTINSELYGRGPLGLHNYGHVILGRVSDPKLTLKLPPGVMLDAGTAMRDPIFYRWHAFINNLFDRHKQNLPPYLPTRGEFPLLWSGVSIHHLSVHLESTTKITSSQNELRTFWTEKKFGLTRGLDFHRPHGSVAVDICAKHLDHEDFTYNLVIERGSFVANSLATIRIFLAPRFDQSGKRFSIEEQRNHFFTLDYFSTELQVGLNNVTHSSKESTLTIPWMQSLSEVDQSTHINSKTPFCGCGFPHHLLLPKGHTAGMIFDLFVMITNGNDDFVKEIEEFGPNEEKELCRSAPIHCGINNLKYPDSKPMGYPFDRLPYFEHGGSSKTLDDYVEGISNTATIQVNITHDEVFRKLFQ